MSEWPAAIIKTSLRSSSLERISIWSAERGPPLHNDVFSTVDYFSLGAFDEHYSSTAYIMFTGHLCTENVRFPFPSILEARGQQLSFCNTISCNVHECWYALLLLEILLEMTCMGKIDLSGMVGYWDLIAANDFPELCIQRFALGAYSLGLAS